MKNRSKIKIAAQVSPNPSDEDIAFIKELGLDYVTLFAGKGEANYDFFMKQREIFESNDLKIYGFGPDVASWGRFPDPWGREREPGIGNKNSGNEFKHFCLKTIDLLKKSIDY